MAMMGTGVGVGEGRARSAAEAAVSSPLLENIDLSGAHGILVNVTAGMDLSIGEFQEVGMIVKQFASEDATVVVGTVIDPEMSNELRVTVVATGLNRAAVARQPVRETARELHREVSREVSREPVREAAATRESPMRVVPKRQPTAVDYAEYDRPIKVRQDQQKRAVGDGLQVEPLKEDLLDIPAFLRRQAD
jgi:cell division protein FtsZ